MNAESEKVYENFSSRRLPELVIDDGAWDKENKPLTQKNVLTLLTRRDFRLKIVKSILRTQTPPDRSLRCQEHGFTALRTLDRYSRSLSLTPIFAGSPGSIDLWNLTDNYKFKNMRRLGYAVVSFAFHTHPKLNLRGCGGELFSRHDLHSFGQLTSSDHSLIFGLGFINSDMSTGSLLMISFKDYRSFCGFSPILTFRKGLESILVYYEPVMGYRETGLNATKLNINLNSCEYLKPDQVIEASHILTERFY